MYGFFEFHPFARLDLNVDAQPGVGRPHRFHALVDIMGTTNLHATLEVTVLQNVDETFS